VGKGNFEVALKVGKPVAKQAATGGKPFLASECPLAGVHIVQGIERLNGEAKDAPSTAFHPIELFARAYGLGEAAPSAGASA
jgi:glycerol-3-phosphate dehydrogenase subunit C